MPKLTPITTLLLWLVLLALTGALLYYNGRNLICPCGTVKFLDFSRNAAEDSQHILDYYSFTHITHGLIFYFVIWLIGRGRIPFLWALLLATVIEGGWELFENSQYIIAKYQGTGISEHYNGDSIINALGDIVVMTVGFVIASVLPAWMSVALLIGVEVVLALLIRDNLTLNIISLTRPIPAISQWQEGGK